MIAPKDLTFGRSAGPREDGVFPENQRKLHPGCSGAESEGGNESVPTRLWKARCPGCTQCLAKEQLWAGFSAEQ